MIDTEAVQSPSTDFGFGADLAFSPAETAVLLASHLSIAAADRPMSAAMTANVASVRDAVELSGDGLDVDGYGASLTDRTTQWLTQLAQLAAPVPDSRRAVLAVSLATTPLFISSTALEHPTTIRRTDAILDLLGVPHSADEIQANVGAAALEIQGGPPADTTRTVARAARPVADLLIWFHPIVGFGAQTILEHLADGSPPQSVLEGSALTLARIVCAHQMASTATAHLAGLDWRTSAARSRDAMLADLRTSVLLARKADKRNAAGLERGMDRLERAGSLLSATTGPAHTLPDLSGLYVREVRRIASAAGLALSAVPTAITGDSPSDGWLVTDQKPTITGSAVTVTAERPSDTTSKAAASFTDTSACEFVGNAKRDDLDRVWLNLREVLPADSPLRAYANATDSSLAITETEAWIFNRDELIDSGAITRRIPRELISDVEVGKEWLDWYIRIHTGNAREQSSRLNFAGNEAAVRRLRVVLLGHPA